jgi:putative ABC transport system ATP-binding protein
MPTSQMAAPASHTTGVAAHAVEITKRYGDERNAITALDRVSVEFGRGRFGAVMGPSGSGMSRPRRRTRSGRPALDAAGTA